MANILAMFKLLISHYFAGSIQPVLQGTGGGDGSGQKTDGAEWPQDVTVGKT